MVRRTTTGMSLNLYRMNLQGTTNRLASSQNKVLTHRKFDSYADDPSSATQAWRVRRAMVNTESYLKNNSDTYTRFQIAYSTLDIASYKLTDLDGRKADIYAASDPTAAGRVALGHSLKQTAQSVAQLMNNAKSGENFIFAGNDELNAPFSWVDDQLYYRGVNVNAGAVKSPAESIPDWVPTDESGNPVNSDKTALAQAYLDTLPKESTATDESDRASEQEWMDYYQGKDGATRPTTNPPGWVPKDEDGNEIAPGETEALAKKYLETLPEKGETDIEQAWVDYYKQQNGGLDPRLNPDKEGYWEGRGRDDYGTLNKMTELSTDKNQSAYNRAWAAYLKDQGDVAKLEAMSKEERTIDVGMGLLENENGKLINGTYFNRSLPGITMLGWGVDDDGDPKNVCMIMMRLGEIYSDCNPESGNYDKDVVSGNTPKAEARREEAMRLLDKLNLGKDHVSNQYVETSTKASLLQQTDDRLTLQRDYLDEQRAELEDVDLADAITGFSWDYYCYSAALKIGTQLLSQSLIDYMS